MTLNKNNRGMVILDVDGVVNSYSNTGFYYSMLKGFEKNLGAIHGRRKLLAEMTNLKESGGLNGLFVFARKYCGSEEKFNEFNRNMIKDLDFDQISYDPSMKAMMRRLQKHGDLCIRSDSLAAIASAVWQRVMEDRPSDEIKKDLLANPQLPKTFTQSLDGKKVNISGIEDNNMQVKTNIQSWHNFADKYNINLREAVLIDDSRANLDVAKSLGMTTIKISKIDSFLQKSPFKNLTTHSLSDILGAKMSKTLKYCQISYGPDVDVKTLFRTLLKKTPSSSLINLFKRCSKAQQNA